MKEANGHAKAAAAVGMRSTALGMGINAALAVVKIAAGVLGNSYALVADGIESTADILSSLIVFVGLKLAAKPADANHPYGHGKFEPLAGLVVAMALFGAAILIGVESVHEIVTPHHAPAKFTLAVLVLVIAVKEALFRFVVKVGEDIKSTAVKVDAWHHRSDAITSAAAFIGISIAIAGGKGYESADDFAALIAALFITFNAYRLFLPSLAELLDTAPGPEIPEAVRRIAEGVEGVRGTHKCRVRKVGFDHYVDLDVLCDPEATIRKGHEIAHSVQDAIRRELPIITMVLVHVEPSDDFGRRSRD